MQEELVGTLLHGDYKAEIFSTSMPGEFKVVYLDPEGKTLDEVPLTGISTYKQRESEIAEQLQKLAHGDPAPEMPERGDAGEY